MVRILLILGALAAFALTAPDTRAVSRDPNGVNVNSNGPTSVFITFGALANQRPAEAFWCGEIEPAPAPDTGFRCRAGTIFGQLPIRFDQSRLSPNAASFTDIMTIPPSVARRAYQAAETGQNSDFFYVRRFINNTTGASEFVFVTCRMAGGGARVPFALLDVRIAFAKERPVLEVALNEQLPPLAAEIHYNGTGRLKGRWEIVMPGEDPPTQRDLLTEATLPAFERGLQRRYRQLERFDVFLPPTGRFVLPGPDPSKLPSNPGGLYYVLLRVEASNDKEADSNLALAGAGQGIVHSGAVAGFPLPPLRYYVGSEGRQLAIEAARGKLDLFLPLDQSAIFGERPVDFSWIETQQAAFYRLEVQDAQGREILSAVLQPGVGAYRAPPWLKERAGGKPLRWRVLAVSPGGEVAGASDWRTLQFGS